MKRSAILPQFFCLLTLLILAVVPAVSAELTFNIKGKVRAKASGFEITDAKYKVYPLHDTVPVKEGNASFSYISGSSDSYRTFKKPTFTISGLPMDKKYVLEVYCENYDPTYIEVDPMRLSRREDTVDVGWVELTKSPRKLQKVTVTATKVKFYHKGDTLIYNADAFQLAQGSMLDELIRQLPGVELKDGGEIFVNGRKVESLLLNSKDFFRGNRSIMLENLSAFTVKDIAVYNRQDKMDRIVGEDYGDKKYTMDVRLKKEYINTMFLNLDAGYGTHGKYMERLFAMWSNEVARVGVFGNANNVSIQSRPGQWGMASITNNMSSDVSVYNGGVDYNVEPSRSIFKMEGNADVNYTRNVRDVQNYVTNFLPGPDTYDYSFSNSKLKSLQVYTEHQLRAEADTWNWQVQPKFRYTRNRDLSKLLSGTFTREWDQIDRAYLDNIFSNNSAEVLSTMINRVKNDNENRGHNAWFNIWTNGKFKVNSVDALSYLAAYTYNRRHDNQIQQYLLNYGDDTTPAQGYYRDYRNFPDFDWRAKGQLTYIWRVTRKMYADIQYTYQRFHDRSISNLWADDNYLTEIAENPAVLLPSALDMTTAPSLKPDNSNSYNKEYNEETHDIMIKISHNMKNISTDVKIPLSVRRQWLRYERGVMYPQIDRTKFFFGDAGVNMNIKPWGFGWMYVAYDRKVTSPDMVNMVNFKNDLDPLNIMKGNPNLKDADSENVRVYYNIPVNKKRNMTYNFAFNGWWYRNSLAYGYSYDRETGVKSGMMYNVMGNATYNTGHRLNFDFARNNCMSFENDLDFDYRRSADLITLEANANPSKNIVNNYGLSDKISLGYSGHGMRIRATADAAWNRYLSHQPGFTPFSAWNIRYVVTGNFKLPYNFKIATDFTIYTRRGYSEPSMNTDNFVWNARLSYTTLKNQLTFVIDGFDILHSLKNVNYTVNAQARTETYTNVLPRYFMFHIQWNFLKTPKL